MSIINILKSIELEIRSISNINHSYNILYILAITIKNDRRQMNKNNYRNITL